MTVPLPAQGDTDWYDWAGSVHTGVTSAVPRTKFSEVGLILSQAGGTPVDILALGDSLFSGQAVTSKYARWPSRMVDALRARLGMTGGFGYVPGYYTHAAPANQAWISSGNTAGQTTYALGRTGRALGADSGSGAGTATITMTCTSFDLSFQRNGTDAFTVQIDGGTATAYPTGPSGRVTVNSGALTRGAHTVVVKQTAGTPVFNGGMFYDGDETRGIRLWDGAQSGSRADQFNTADGGSSVWADQIGSLFTPELVLIEWMTNDAAARTLAQYQTSLANILSLVRSKAATVPIVFVAPYERTAAGLIEPWANYVAAMQAVAATDSHSYFINMADRVPNLSTDTYGVKADSIHPNDKLAGWLGEALAAELLAL